MPNPTIKNKVDGFTLPDYNNYFKAITQCGIGIKGDKQKMESRNERTHLESTGFQKVTKVI